MYGFKSAPVLDQRREITDNASCNLLKVSPLKDLLKKAKKGDKIAVEEICRRFNGIVINAAISFYVNGYTLEDMIQEGRLSLIKAIGSYDLSSPYTFGVYAREALKKNFYWKIRSNKKEAACCSLYSLNSFHNEIIDMVASGENVEEDFMKMQQKIDLWKAVENLSEEERNIIIWYYVLEKDLKEYAVKKGISYRTAAYRKKRALYNLRKYMDSESP